MRARRLLIASLLPLLGGCLPWGDASQWEGVGPGIVSWDWVLDEGSIPPSPPAVDFLGLDAIDTEERYVRDVIGNGTTAWCYVSVGTAEDFRDDYAAFVALDAAEREAGNPPILGDELPMWPGERWLNVQRYPVFLELMADRFRVCASKGFTLVEFDNMDGYANETGFSPDVQASRTFVAALVSEAQDQGLGVIHKNAEELIEDLEPSMDALLLESCVQYDFCAAGEAFLRSGKPVFNAEYPAFWRDEGRSVDVDAICLDSEAAGVNTLLKRPDLDDRSIVCAAR
jgi:endo-alpha-1,4-polygalactosaminidase (GH114 family)